MSDTVFVTDYAPAERTPEALINVQAEVLEALPLLVQLLDAVPDIVFILNEQRQIVFANQAAVEVFNISNRRDIYGLRPGEVLNCVHSGKNAAGCGTSSFCKTCGAVNAIVEGLRGKKKIEECRISQKPSGKAFDLSVAATPFTCGNDSFVIFVATDISHEKRRDVLERTFFHDILNTLSGVVGYAELLSTSPQDNQKSLLERLIKFAYRLQEEINSQKGLVAAEKGDVSLCLESIRSREFLHEMISFYQGDLSSSAIPIDLDEAAVNVGFISDKTLLSRVFGNMLKNAIEASQPGDTVLAGCRSKDDTGICFWVQNAQFIPPDVQTQIYNRSFSTKGTGRGIGTYSMKLFTEKYLKGEVSFSTSREKGTVFSVSLPLILKDQA